MKGVAGTAKGWEGRELTAQEGTLVEGCARTAAARARTAVVYFIVKRGVWAAFDEARTAIRGCGWKRSVIRSRDSEVQMRCGNGKEEWGGTTHRHAPARGQLGGKWGCDGGGQSRSCNLMRP